MAIAGGTLTPIKTPAGSKWGCFLLAVGYEGYGYGYGYGQDGSGGYGYGMATSNSWEMASSDVDMNPDASGGTGDAVAAKMNQRLDMAAQMEAETMPGGPYGAGGDR